MQTNEILEALDAQIIKLQQARAILAGVSVPTTEVATTKRRGRPKGSVSKPTTQTAPALPVKSSKRAMSAEGKARLVAALKARWAAKKKNDKLAKAAVAKVSPSPAKKSPKPAKKAISGATKKTAPTKAPAKSLTVATGA
jgi:hypothetical protein